MLGMCVSINAFFVVSEYSLISVRQSRIQELIDDGNHAAVAVYALKKDLDRTLHCLQFGVTVTTLTLGWLSQDAVQPVADLLVRASHIGGYQAPPMLVFAFCCGLVVYLQVIFGEQVPKIASINLAEDLTLRLARTLSVYCLVMRPVVWVFDKSISGVLSLLPGSYPVEQGTVVSPDELEIILQQSEEAGELTERQTDMLEGVLDLHDECLVQHILVPLEKIDAVLETVTLPELLATLASKKRTKLVVYRGSIHNIIGVVHTKDLFDLLANLVSPAHAVLIAGFALHKWMRPVYRVKGSVRASDLLDEMRRRRTQIAIVIDDTGKNIGMVTMEDLLEKIVGDIYDHHETPKSPPPAPPHSSGPPTDGQGG
jgi:putative hemolysin